MCFESAELLKNRKSLCKVPISQFWILPFFMAKVFGHKMEISTLCIHSVWNTDKGGKARTFQKNQMHAWIKLRIQTLLIFNPKYPKFKLLYYNRTSTDFRQTQSNRILRKVASQTLINYRLFMAFWFDSQNMSIKSIVYHNKMDWSS